MIQIYVSYAVPDIRYAIAVEDALSGDNFSLWLADVSDPQRLVKMDLVIAIVTAASLSRSQTLHDWMLARARGRLLLLQCEERSLPAFLQDMPRISYQDPDWKKQLCESAQLAAMMPLQFSTEGDSTTTQIVPDWVENVPEPDMLPLPAGKYAHVFLATSSGDRVLARRIVKDLRHSGVLALLDPPAWQTSVISCVCVVALLTPDMPADLKVEQYLQFAENQQIPVYPALVRGTPGTATPLRLSQYPYIDLVHEYRRGLMALVRAIRKHL
jgi:hypothetical protein